MQIRVSPTRMQLLRLRQRLALARRGHKLLKDKLDGMIQQFFGIKNDYLKLHADLEPRLIELFTKTTLASALTPPQVLKQNGSRQAMVSSEMKNIRGVRIPKYTLEVKGDLPDYSRLLASSEYTWSLNAFSEILPELIKLAGLNQALELIAREIIQTRRRVNALEYVLMPELERNLKSIRMKLTELEHSSQVVLLKIKDIVRAH
jgi:V/A-type H+-transporting ATPase subunit D